VDLGWSLPAGGVVLELQFTVDIGREFRGECFQRLEGVFQVREGREGGQVVSLRGGNPVAGDSRCRLRSGLMGVLPPVRTEEDLSAVRQNGAALWPGIERLCRLLGVSADGLTR
jgi:hypothetical protein